jgi:hypothetical protein
MLLFLLFVASLLIFVFQIFPLFIPEMSSGSRLTLFRLSPFFHLDAVTTAI